MGFTEYSKEMSVLLQLSLHGKLGFTVDSAMINRSIINLGKGGKLTSGKNEQFLAKLLTF